MKSRMDLSSNTGIERRDNESLEKLGNVVNQYRRRSKAESTCQAYRRDLKKFTEWCEQNTRSPLPASPDTVALYIAYLADTLHRAPSTISRVMTSISQAHKLAGHRTPTNAPDVTTVWQGIRRVHGTSQKRAKALTTEDLKKVIASIIPSFLGKRDRALLLIGWAAAMRRSEIVALDVGDVEFVDEGMIITIRKSKTDQTGEGFKIGIPRAKDVKCCPVDALRRWLDLARHKSGPLFFSVGTPGNHWHVQVDEPKRLVPKTVNLILSRRMKQAGLSCSGFSGHSLRAGFITSAAKNGTPENLIQLHTRHRSSRVLRGYIRDGSLFENNPLFLLL